MASASTPEYIVENVPFSWLMEHEQNLAPLLAMQQESIPFQSLPRLMSWWEAYGQDYEAHVLAIRHGGEIAGGFTIDGSERQGHPHSKKHCGNIKRLFKRLQKTPLLDVSCAHEFTPGLLDEIIEVERHSWKAQEGSLRLEGRGRKFYEAFLRNLAERHQLELWFCRYNGTLLAYLITFNYRDSIFYYNGAYRSNYASFHADISPGSLLIACAVKNAHDRGLKAFDFLRGDEPYKK